MNTKKKILLFILVLSIWVALGMICYWLWKTGNIFALAIAVLLVMARVCYVNLKF